MVICYSRNRKVSEQVTVCDIKVRTLVIDFFAAD